MTLENYFQQFKVLTSLIRDEIDVHLDGKTPNWDKIVSYAKENFNVDTNPQEIKEMYIQYLLNTRFQQFNFT